MSATYTPGTWEHETEDSWGTIWGAGRPIARVVGDSAEAEANARLLASAPELLEALSAAYTFITQPQIMRTPKDEPATATYRIANYNALTAKLRAALAKADPQS